ncbi:stress response protein nst1 [Drosophila guanche]|uniref:Blast:Protein MNN4 n=1 Tax=Drosophila guanche TaxID=7266 RepID=A0A3B0KLR2_DROGU|nr:stress response protein nst1 [Drosophila guanche]SPP86021.1 blast:Protein MNN4 [Drosophila guanche]
MTFQSQKNETDKVVEEEELFSGYSSTNLIEISDSEESIDGFSDRSLGAPTVRFVGAQKPFEEQPEPTADEDEYSDSESQHTFVGHDEYNDDADDSDTDDILEFCHQLEEEEARDALGGLTINDDDLESIMNCYKNTPRPDGEEADSRSESSYDSEMGDYLKPTVIPGKKSMGKDNSDVHGDADSLDSFNSCSVGSASGRNYIRSNATQQDWKFLEASSDREQQISRRTYNIETSSQSTCSWSQAYGAAFQASEGSSNYLPPLNLNSRSSESSATYYKSLEEKKERDGLKYEEWKKRKDDQERKKLAAAKRQHEKEQREMEKRAEDSKKHYEAWFQRKQEQKLLDNKKKLPVLKTNSNRNKETPEEVKERVKEWERRKIEGQKQERERLRRQRELFEEKEKKRLQLSEAAYSKWMEDIDSRPIPVPLNQGFDSLRGTVSKIYVNPNQWDSSIDPSPDQDDRFV